MKFFSYFSFFLFRQPFIKSYLYAAGTSTGKITVARPQKGLQSGLGKKKKCFLKQFFVEKVDLFSKTHVFKCIQNDLCLWCLASCFSYFSAGWQHCYHYIIQGFVSSFTQIHLIKTRKFTRLATKTNMLCVGFMTCCIRYDL